jgi:hypothetical protein
MENDPNNADAPVTRAGLKAEFGKLEEKMEQLLSEQADVILEAVGETMEKKLDEKFDPVITKLDGIMKGVEALQQENTVGAEQLRRHEDQLQKHEARIASSRPHQHNYFSPMLVHKCDNCKNEIKGREKEIIAGFAWPQFSGSDRSSSYDQGGVPEADTKQLPAENGRLSKFGELERREVLSTVEKRRE